MGVYLGFCEEFEDTKGVIRIRKSKNDNNLSKQLIVSDRSSSSSKMATVSSNIQTVNNCRRVYPYKL
jgi:hypothetical protein